MSVLPAWHDDDDEALLSFLQVQKDNVSMKRINHNDSVLLAINYATGFTLSIFLVILLDSIPYTEKRWIKYYMYTETAMVRPPDSVTEEETVNVLQNLWQTQTTQII